MTRVVAKLTSKFHATGYSSMTTEDVESMSVDSAMDTDTDSWQLSIGDPTLELTAVLKRDAECRVNLFGLNNGRTMSLNTGFADEITLDENNVLNFTGRDISAVAVDSQHPPGEFKLVRPDKFVTKDSITLKIADKLDLKKGNVFKTFTVDGSETYWETWYRLYRKSSMWLWVEPDGTLTADRLNYKGKPSYSIGTGRGFIPVQRCEIRSNKQQRLWQVFVIGDRGDRAFVSKANDPTVKDWVKKRSSYLRSATAHNAKEAKVEAWEELFEGKVGAVEITVAIADPGFIVRQNRIAFVNIPQVGLKGNFFVVGAKSFATQADGLYQEIRLREISYAISKRVPEDPSLAGTTPSTFEKGFDPSIGAVPIPLDVRWKYHFVEASNKYHSPWPYKLFLGMLLAIADHETKFQNVRYHGHVEYPGTDSGEPPSVFDKPAYAKFVAAYANEPKYGRIKPPPGFQQWAVGPMQIYDAAYKEKADELGGTAADELVGARWIPRFNILAGAYALKSKLHGLEAALGNGGDPEKLMLTGISGYAGSNKLGKEIFDIYVNTYAGMLDEAVKATQTTSADKKGKVFPFYQGTPYKRGGGVAAHHSASDNQGVDPDEWQSLNAVDIMVYTRGIGDIVLAPMSGTIAKIGGTDPAKVAPHNGRYGYQITCQTNSDEEWFITHIGNLSILEGQKVTAGQKIGRIANWGESSHLHMALKNGDPEECYKWVSVAA